jgi:hypothetical protein
MVCRTPLVANSSKLTATDGDVRPGLTDRYGHAMPFDNRVTRLLGVEVPVF